jgi:DNA end-binding protein Ku
MRQLHFEAEVRPIKDVGLEPAAVSEAGLKLADHLIEHLSAKRFDPNKFHDEFKVRVEATIQRKVAGKEVSLAEAPVAKSGGNVIDLMAALEASLDAKSSPAAVKERKVPKKAASTNPRWLIFLQCIECRCARRRFATG